MSGKLYLVPTPIGNLDDITLRAISVLQSVDQILCEDTRHSGKLLKHHGISNKLSPFHQHNEHKAADSIVEQLKEGKEMALISDAGTPGISDPGFLLVRACVDNGVDVEVLPGATAIIPALAGSGLPSDRFTYLGFPPHKKGRATFWANCAEYQHTIVLYESPHRIEKALSEAVEVLSEDRNACLVREISKIHATYHRGTLAELLEQAKTGAFKGELVLIIEGAPKVKRKKKYESTGSDQGR